QSVFTRPPDQFGTCPASGRRRVVVRELVIEAMLKWVAVFSGRSPAGRRPLHHGGGVGRGRGIGDDFECDAEAIGAAIAARRPFSVFHRASIQKIDIVVRHDSDYELEKFERRHRLEIEGQPVWAIAPEDLILSKLQWAKESPSELQLRDVRAIVAVQADLDWPYIDGWARRLTVTTLLAGVRP
ncbi:MAG TPA: hypothetical protein VLD67_11280, partial [Vicinamibacterales bacterium]|nr:hypothetical protein [Vicinamibacterales bacterium]